MNPTMFEGELFCSLGQPLAVYEDGSRQVLDPERFRNTCKWLMMHANDEDQTAVISSVRRNFLRLDAGAWQVSNPFDIEVSQNPVAWIAKSTDRQLAHFVEWNHGRYDMMTRALNRDRQEIAGRVEALLTNIRYDMGTDMNVGAHAASMLMANKIVPLSSFEIADHGATAICEPDQKAGKVGYIAISNLFTDAVSMEGVSAQMVAISMHEAIHAVCLELLAGFYDGVTELGQFAGVIEEAIIAHIEEAAQHGQYDTLATRLREEPGAAYTELRDLFGVLLSQGVAYAEPDMIDEALFSPIGKRSRARQKLSSTFDIAVRELLPRFAIGQSVGWVGLCAALNNTPHHKRHAYAERLADEVYDAIMPSITLDDDFELSPYERNYDVYSSR